MKLSKDLEIILDAAEEGYRNCESDAGDGVDGAAKTMKKYGDAFASIDGIRRRVQFHPVLLAYVQHSACDSDIVGECTRCELIRKVEGK